MLQATGVILDANGVSEYVNPLINIYMNSGSKFQPTIGVAQIGKIVGEGETESFNIVAEIGTYNYIAPNPSFEEVQEFVLECLKLDYPTVTFTIIP